MVYLDEKTVEGKLEWDRDGPMIHATGTTYRSNAKYKMHSAIGHVNNKEEARLIKLPHEFIVTLEPNENVIRGYMREPTQKERVYPPSTLNWYAHYVVRKNPATYFVQDTNHPSKLWLTCIDYYTRDVLFSYPVNLYEAAGLWVSQVYGPWTIKQIIRRREGFTRLVGYFQELLSAPSPDWKDIMELIRDAPIRKFKMGDNMRETLDPIVPSQIHESLRFEIMAFLAWTLTRERGFPKNDPIDINKTYFAAPTFNYLALRHLAFSVTSDSCPKYGQFICIADEFAKNRKDYEDSFLKKLFELVGAIVPSTTDPLADLDVENLYAELVDLRKSASYDRTAWLKLMLLGANYARLRGDINYKSLGLRQMVYLGAAYRWPYRHLSWWVELNEGKAVNRRLHSLVVPPRIIPKLTRIFPAEIVEWSVRVTNLNLRKPNGSWDVAWNRMLRSATIETSLDKLKKEYGPYSTVPVVVSKKDAHLLDVLYLGFHLPYMLEGFEASPSEGFAREEISERLEHLTDNNILYNLNLIDNSLSTILKTSSAPLKTVLIILEGNSSGILSLVRALLRYSPSCTPFLTQNNNRAYILVRLVKNAAKLAELNEVAKSNDVRLKIIDIQSYDSVAASLLERLWIDEGKWEEDLSTLLSQSQYRATS